MAGRVRTAHAGHWIDPQGQYPDDLPGTGPVDPPIGDLPYGTPIFGQSYDRYKAQGGQTSYNSIENDTVSVIGGVTRKGSGVTRTYRTGSWGRWDVAELNIPRAGQAVIHSAIPSASVSTADFKEDLRDHWRSKSTNLAVHGFECTSVGHEPDDDIRAGGGWVPGATKADRLTKWQDWNIAMLEVFDEAEFRDRTDIWCIPILTAVPTYTKTSEDTVEHYYERIKALAPRGWHALGIDKYQPNFDVPVTSNKPPFVTITKWLSDIDRIHGESALGLNIPVVLPEMGSPRPYPKNQGLTVAQQNQAVADWTVSLCAAMQAKGYFAFVCWWRQISTKLDGYPTLAAKPFSSVEFTPTGYNSAADVVADPNSGPPNGLDNQPLCDAWALIVHNAMLSANRTMSFMP